MVIVFNDTNFHQKIEKPNNLKVFGSKKAKGQRVKSTMDTYYGRRRTLVLIITISI
jgi:hypothetical protein